MPGPQNVDEEASLAINSISVSDPDNNVTSVALTVLNGTLTVTPAGTALVAGGGASLTISGNQTDINLTLASLVYTGNLDYVGPDTLTVTSTDAGGLQDVDAITITVDPVNDPPQNTVPGSITVTEDVASAITGIAIADLDVGPGALVVTLSVPSGTLTATTGGGVAVGGSGSGTLTLAGTLTDLNTFLSLPSVSFTTAPGATAPVTLTVSTSDQGNTGSGGVLIDSDPIVLSVTSVNDAPVGTDATVLTAEDTPYTFTLANFGFSDPGDTPANAFLAVRMQVCPPPERLPTTPCR